MKIGFNHNHENKRRDDKKPSELDLTKDYIYFCLACVGAVLLVLAAKADLFL